MYNKLYIQYLLKVNKLIVKRLYMQNSFILSGFFLWNCFKILLYTLFETRSSYIRTMYWQNKIQQIKVIGKQWYVYRKQVMQYYDRTSINRRNVNKKNVLIEKSTLFINSIGNHCIKINSLNFLKERVRYNHVIHQDELFDTSLG